MAKVNFSDYVKLNETIVNEVWDHLSIDNEVLDELIKECLGENLIGYETFVAADILSVARICILNARIEKTKLKSGLTVSDIEEEIELTKHMLEFFKEINKIADHIKDYDNWK